MYQVVIVMCVFLCQLTQSVVSRELTLEEFCPDLEPVWDFDMDSMLGMYYISEIIYHQWNWTETEISSYCFHAYLRKLEDFLLDGATDPTISSYYQPTTAVYTYGPHHVGVEPERRYRHLVLQWNEPGNMLEYHVKLNMTRRGFWISTAPHNGARIAEMYKHFAGTIQVLKAVSDHLVLAFCQRLPEQQIFTAILARQQRPRLDDGELIAIHSLLSSKRLSTSNLKKVCSGAVALLVRVPRAALALVAYVLLVA